MTELPPADKEIRLSQGPIRYRDTGGGEALLFVHGLLVNGLLWRETARELERDVRCIVPDWPLGSHTAPMDPDADLSAPGIARLIADFIEALKLDSVTLVGNDSGGAVSQIVATEHPQRVGRLVLTNCDAFDNFPPRMFRYLGVFARIPGGVTAMAQTMRIKANRRAPIAFGALTKRRLDDELLEAWVRPGLEDSAVRRDGGKFIRGMSPKHTEQAARKIGRFRAPALFAWAPEDRFFPIEHAERLAAAMQDARLERIPDAKAFVSLDQPQRLAGAIRDFVRETSAAPAAA
jgi:pimeloyl-ACP methyl ester carboxylesterase